MNMFEFCAVVLAFPADFSLGEQKQTLLLADTLNIGTKKRHAQVAVA